MRFSSDERFVALLLTVILRVAHLALCVWASFDLGGLLLPSGGGGGGGGIVVVMMAAKSRASARSAVNGQPDRVERDGDKTSDRISDRDSWASKQSGTGGSNEHGRGGEAGQARPRVEGNASRRAASDCSGASGRGRSRGTL